MGEEVDEGGDLAKSTTEMNMDIDSSSSISVPGVLVFPTEDVVQALLDFLVEPILPLRSSSSSVRDHSSSLALQQSMAKQMHAVVLLYNYYHRKQFPQLEFLDFESFCKVSVNAKPSLLVHMKFMQSCNSESDELLSPTEKAIMDACNISLGLDALRDAPCIEGWPVSKIAIFLTDHMKKNCLLLFSSTTQGVWSLLEKTIDDFSNKLGSKLEEEKANNKNDDEASFQQLAFSAVKETTGIDQSGITVLERHVVPSISAEKTATCFYLMRLTKPIDGDLINVPIEDAINSLQGPLVKKDFGSYAVSTVVEYFHLLPYAGILSDWFSRAGQENVNIEYSPAADNPDSEKSDVTCQTPDILGKKASNCITGIVNQDDNDDRCMIELSDSLCKLDSMAEEQLSNGCRLSEDKSVGAKNMVPVNHIDKKMSPSEDKSLATKSKVPINHIDKKMKLSVDSGKKTRIRKSACKYEENKLDKVSLVTKPHNSGKSTSEKVPCRNDDSNMGFSGQDGICTGASSMAPPQSVCGQDGIRTRASSMGPPQSVWGQDGIHTGASSMAPTESNSQNLDKIHSKIASKAPELLQAALRVFHMKSNELSHQQRLLQDEIALCEKKLQTILSEGDDDLMLNFETIIEACNIASNRGSPQTHLETHQHGAKGSAQDMKKKKLSEAILSLRNPCQELDNICSQNNWILPTYNVLPLNGEGFRATVIVQGMDFECSDGGDLKADPREARESAAAHILTKLRNMASQARKGNNP